MLRIGTLALLVSVGLAHAEPTLIFEGGEALNLKETVPDVNAPSIGTGTCMGALTGGMAISGLGLAAGKSIFDRECNIRYNSVRLDELGQDEAAVEIMCLIPEAHLALITKGYACSIGYPANIKTVAEQKKSNYHRIMSN